MKQEPFTVTEAEIVEDNQIILCEIKYPVSQVMLKDLLEEYKEIPDINPDADEDLVGTQYQYVLKGHKAFVKARTSIEKTRKTLKQPALDYGKSVDGIAKEFQAMIKTTEDKLQLQRKRVEDNEARKQAEAEALEEARIDEIKNRILSVKNLPLQHFNSSSEDITRALESLVVISIDVYDEFFDEAVESQNYVISQLQTARDNKLLVENASKIQAEKDEEIRKAKEIEDAKLQAERDEFNKQQEEFNKQKQDFERQQREQQEVIDRQKAELEADELAKKQDFDRQQREQQGKENFDKAKADLVLQLKELKTITKIADAIITGNITGLSWVY